MQPLKIPIYQSEQIHQLERLAKEKLALNGQSLMQRAGKAAFDYMQRRWPHAQKIAVFCGGGNNGGDGYELASLAALRGLAVTIWQVGQHDHQPDEAKEALQNCQRANVPIFTLDEKSNLNNPDLIIDAICGIGAHTTLRDEVVAAIKKINHLHIPVLALDVPTGIDADTGQVLDSAIRATSTITFLGLKMGLLTGSGMAYAGELVSHDLQVPPDLFTAIEPVAEKIQLAAFAHYLAPRMRDWHKGLSGHVLVVGGGPGYAGAPHMAAEAALRVGAGLVTVATHPDHAEIMSLTCPELMSRGISAPQDLAPLLEKADVIIVGPGLTQTPWALAIWDYLSQQNHPMVVDADALNILARSDLRKDNWVLTPHPGEAGRLLETSAEAVQLDRLAAIVKIQKRYAGVCVLKGAGSLVLAPNSLPALTDKGNPGMASGGMGDVLSGVIGGLMASGIPLGDAAKLGVCMHAMAGDLAAKAGERGMIATDLMPYLRLLSNPARAE